MSEVAFQRRADLFVVEEVGALFAEFGPPRVDVVLAVALAEANVDASAPLSTKVA